MAELADKIEKRRNDFGKRESPHESFTIGFGLRFVDDIVRQAIYKAEVHDELMRRLLKGRKERADPTVIPFPDPRAKFRLVRLKGFPLRRHKKPDPNLSLDFPPHDPGAA